VTDTRSRIRERALTLFLEKGYAGTSIADIERAAGLAPRTGAFYRHFPSKIDLAVEIGETSIIESRAELGFDGVLPLGDTRAELVLIAKGYRRAADRQAPLMGLIAELRGSERIRALERRVNDELLDALLGWLGAKPFSRGKDGAELTALLVTVFGGWLFYLWKRDGSLPALTDEVMLETWAGYWAEVLDRAP
jgi:AcrR family transcriptional regulator